MKLLFYKSLDTESNLTFGIFTWMILVRFCRTGESNLRSTRFRDWQPAKKDHLKAKDVQEMDA